MLEAFLDTIGSRNHAGLLNISIHCWITRKTTKSFDFALLRGATNLQRLYVHDVECGAIAPPALARSLRRHAAGFFDAYGEANGRKDAVAKIISVGWRNFLEYQDRLDAKLDHDQREHATRMAAELKRSLGKTLVNAQASKKATSKA